MLVSTVLSDRLVVPAAGVGLVLVAAGGAVFALRLLFD
jgi:hypothetical protein